MNEPEALLQHTRKTEHGFSDLKRDNIRYGKLDATDEAIEAAITLSSKPPQVGI